MPQGGVWAECTNNEWTLSTKQMTIDVGVIGPFEKGYLREAVSDRTFLTLTPTPTPTLTR